MYRGIRALTKASKKRNGGEPSAPLDSTKIFMGITGNGTNAETKTVSNT